MSLEANTTTINVWHTCPSCFQAYKEGIFHQCPTWGVYQPFPITMVTEPTFTVKQIQDAQRYADADRVMKVIDSYNGSEGSDTISLSKLRKVLERLRKEIEEG